MSEERQVQCPWEVPPTWCWRRLGDVTAVVGGGTPSTQDSDNWIDGTIPWITPADLSGYDGKCISGGERSITRRGLEASGAKLMPAGTVLFSSRAPIGYVAIATQPVSTNQGFKSFVPTEALVPDYVYYFLKGNKELALQLASGTTFLEISGKKAAQIPIPIAPLSEQRRIVNAIEEHLPRIDAADQALRRVRANLKRCRAAVLRAACEGRLVPTEAELARQEGRGYESANVLLERILEERRARWEADELAKLSRAGKKVKGDAWRQNYNEPRICDTDGLSGLPEGWTWVRAEQVCAFITKGTTPSSDKLFSGHGEVPFIKVYNLTHTGSLDFSVNPTFVSRDTHEGELGRSKVFPGDVLMNIVGPPLGKVSLVPSAHPEWNVNQAIAIFRAIPGLDREYLRILLLNESILRWAIQRSKATAGQFNLTLETCRDLPLPLPPLAEQRRIVAEVDRRLSALETVRESIELDLRRADRLRQAILKRAFEGKLVLQDPTDEPASALLERIRAESEAAVPKARKRKPATTTAR